VSQTRRGFVPFPPLPADPPFGKSLQNQKKKIKDYEKGKKKKKKKNQENHSEG